MFDAAEAASHLLRRGLTARSAGSSYSATALRLTGRNLVYRVQLDGGAPLLLKRAVDAETRQGLEREARAYDVIAGAGAPPVTPRKLDFDPSSSTLALEFLSAHRPVTNSVARGGLNGGLASALGSLLARLHAIPAPTGDTAPPWILGLVHPPVAILREASYGQLDVMRHVQGSASWRSALESLAEEWRPRSLVHGDLRFSNILRGEDRSGEPALMLVDWELAGGGDPGWDTGWILAELLAARARHLAEAFPLVRAFWTQYAAAAGDAATHVPLDRTLRWSAAAALQLAYEEARSPYADAELAARLLEVGRSLLERPGVWIERVFASTVR